MEISNKSIWPPPYSLRLSKKARHLHIKITTNHGLEIVVPYQHRNSVDIAGLLEEKKSWIDKHLSQTNRVIQTPTAIELLELHAIQQQWHIEYQATNAKRIQGIIRPHSNKLVLHGNVANIELTHTWLKSWLKQTAQKYLLPWLANLSVQHKLPYKKVTIRAQRTLWGSCNWQKNINLNYKLLFLPKNYVTHIMLHELCHTKFLNHSKRFWNMLATLDPNYIQHNKAIRSADQYIPSTFCD